MGVIAQRWADWSPPSVSDDGHWTTQGGMAVYPSSAGVVTSESAMRISAVFASVNILADALAQIPCILYDRLPDDAGKTRSNDRLAALLDDQPNADQSSFEFRFQMQAWASVRPFAYAEQIYSGDRLEQLVPRHPDRIRVERLKNGAKRYAHYEDDRTWRPILAEDMFRVPGKPVLDYARESFGMAQSLQRYAGTTFTKGIRPGGLISTEPHVDYDDGARAKLKAAIEKEHGGPSNAGGILMLPDGLKWTQLGMTHEQAELVAFTTTSVEDIARWFTIPPYRLGVLKAGTVSYASVEMQSLDMLVYTLMPWYRRWEQAIGKDLITSDRQFAEFLTAAFLKGTTKERFDAYAIAIQWGWLSVNDVRRIENLNPVAGGDVYLRPLNMTPAAARAAVGAHSEGGRLLRLLVDDTSGQVVRKEVAAMLRAAERHADDPAAWERTVAEFYEAHGPFVATKLHLPLGEALAYARSQRNELLAEGPTVLPHWQTNGKADELAALALPEVA